MNTLRRCHSIVRWLRKSARRSLVRQTLARQLRDLALLRRQIIPSLRSSLADFSRPWQQLVAGSVSERLHPQRSRARRVRRAVGPLHRRAYSLASAIPHRGGGPGRARRGRRGLTEMLDRLQIKGFGGVADADEEARAVPQVRWPCGYRIRWRAPTAASATAAARARSPLRAAASTSSCIRSGDHFSFSECSYATVAAVNAARTSEAVVELRFGPVDVGQDDPSCARLRLF